MNVVTGSNLDYIFRRLGNVGNTLSPECKEGFWSQPVVHTVFIKDAKSMMEELVARKLFGNSIGKVRPPKSVLLHGGWRLSEGPGLSYKISTGSDCRLFISERHPGILWLAQTMI